MVVRSYTFLIFLFVYQLFLIRQSAGSLELHDSQVISIIHSLQVLVSVSPDGAAGDDSRVSGRLLQVGCALVHAVHGLEVLGLVGGSVSNHDLTGVLVWHHYARLR